MTDSEVAFLKAVVLSQPILKIFLGTVLLREPILKIDLQSRTVLKTACENEF
jgi:hypothetical protein